MKTKSKLLLALSALTVGTVAAGTTATFAWFTTNRTATAHMTNITASNKEGNLKIAFNAITDGSILANDTGTSNPLTNEAGTDVTAKFNQDLRDLSSKDGFKFYAPVWDASKSQLSYSNGGHQMPQAYEVYKNKSGDNGYIQFYLSITNEGKSDLEVYLDPSQLGIAGATAEGEQKTKNDALASFMRVAIVSTENTQPTSGYNNGQEPNIENPGQLVFMNSNTANYDRYVTGTKLTDLTADDDGTAAYDDPTEHFFSTPGSMSTISVIAAKSDTDRKLEATYLGTVEADGGNDTIYVSVAIWMEGTCADSDAADGGVIDIDLGFTALDPNSDTGA